MATRKFGERKTIPVRITAGPLAGKTGTINTSEFDPTKMEIAGIPGASLKAIAPLSSLLGAIGGTLAGGPVGTFAGGTGGYAGGKVLKRNVEDIITGGRTRPSTIENTGTPGYVGEQIGGPSSGDVGESLLSGATMLSGQQILKSLSDFANIAKGPKHVGKMREDLIKEKNLTMPRESIEKAFSKVDPNKYTSTNQGLSKEAQQNVLAELFPFKDVAPSGLKYMAQAPDTGLNRAYGIVNQLEKEMGVKYGGKTPAPVKDVFSLIRGVANQSSPDVQSLNKLYQKAKESRKYSDMAKGSVYKFALYKLLGKLLPGM